MNTNLVSRIYLSMCERGNVDGVTTLVKKIGNVLEPLYLNKILKGYDVFPLHDSESIEEEMHDETEIRLISEDILPVVMVVISYASENVDKVHKKLPKIEDEFELKMLSGHAR